VIIGALESYLKLPTSLAQGNETGTRLELLERKVAELEKLSLVFGSLPNSVADSKNSDTLPAKILDEELETSEEVQIEEKQALEGTTLNLFSLDDNGFDNADNKLLSGERFTHRQIEAITGLKYNTVKSRSARGVEVEHKGETYIPLREGTRIRWSLKTSDNTDNEEDPEF
jgi:hypothetical protein